MKTTAVLFTIFFFLIGSLQAMDIGNNDWHTGKVVLRNGKIMQGELRYDLKQNVTMVRRNGQIKAFSSYNVDHFKFMDNHRKTLRSFYTMPYQQANGQKRLMFFELIFQDGFALFNRDRSIHKKQAMLSKFPFVADKEDEEEVTVFSYYILMEDGSFQPIQTEEHDVVDKLSLDKEKRRDMQKFIIRNGLNLKNRSDFIRVIHKFVNEDQQT